MWAPPVGPKEKRKKKKKKKKGRVGKISLSLSHPLLHNPSCPAIKLYLLVLSVAPIHRRKAKRIRYGS